MSLLRFGQALAAGAVLLTASWSHAQCTKDTDCKGQRVCTKGTCVAGSAAAPAAPTPAPATVAPAPAAAPVAAPAEPVAAPPEEPPKPRMQRHSTGMMVGGIVMVSLAPVALLVSGMAAIGKGLCNVGDDDPYDSCDDDYDPTIYGALGSAFVLVGVGVPLIVIGAKKEPVDDSNATRASKATATVAPWATPSAAGVTLRVDL